MGIIDRMELLLGFILGFTLSSYLWNAKVKIWVNKNVFKKQPKVIQPKPNEANRTGGKP
jgi:hypothetical protein